MANEVGARLETARKMRGLDRTEVDMIAGVSNGVTADIEVRGRIPKPETTRKLCRALRIRVEWLMTEDGPMDDEEP